MSTDLEFLLPVISDDRSCVIQSSITDNHHEGCCRTPKSPRHMIPAVLRCPPPPKKPRPAVCRKRKSCELQFFESVARREIEQFFEMVEVNFNGSTKRKHCTL